MRRGLILVAAGLLLFCFSTLRADAEERFPATEWERVAPAASGWSVEKLARAQAFSAQIGSTAVMIVEHGAMVAEWGDVAARTPLASIRKSLLSALIGIAVARGQIDLAQNMAGLGIDDNPPSLSAEEKTATVRDLLEARSGIYHPALYETADMAAKRPPRFSHQPGTFWYYNNWDFNTLGMIYEHAARTPIFDALAREIAQPIGMQDYRPADGHYVTGPDSLHPAYPIDMSARDLARFALLYLHQGRWRDRQVVPADWVAASTRAYSEAGLASGYGYLWWVGWPGGFGVTASALFGLPPGSFFAAGHGNQFALVIPGSDMIIIRRGNPRTDISTAQQIRMLLQLVLEAAPASNPPRRTETWPSTTTSATASPTSR